MAKIISVGKDNLLKSLWRKFKSLDLFTRLFIITIILLAIATPFIIYNYQLFNVHGETEVQRLQAIYQLQKSQKNLQDIFARSSTIPNPSALTTDTTLPNPAGGFNLIDAIRKILMRIAQIFN